MRVIEALGTVEPILLDSRNATRTCRDGSVVGLIGGWCPEDSARAGAQSMNAAPLADWKITRFAIGAVAGAAAIFILWRLK